LRPYTLRMGKKIIPSFVEVRHKAPRAGRLPPQGGIAPVSYRDGDT
jgi:hypothetical protein